jgi:hypothetical protein
MQFLRKGVSKLVGATGLSGDVHSDVAFLAGQFSQAESLAESLDALQQLSVLLETNEGQFDTRVLQILVQGFQKVQDVEEGGLMLMDLLARIVFNPKEFENGNPLVVERLRYFVKEKDHVASLWAFMENPSPRVRLHILKFFNFLFSKFPEVVGEAAVSQPESVTLLVEALGDVQEVVRNESLLLISSLSAVQPEIQKMVAFNGGFETIFRIIRDEGGLGSSVVVNDCLECLLRLLDGNVQTQRFYREMGLFKHLMELLPLEEGTNLFLLGQPVVNGVSSVMRIAWKFISHPPGKEDATTIIENSIAMVRSGFVGALMRVSLFPAPPNVRGNIFTFILSAFHGIPEATKVVQDVSRPYINSWIDMVFREQNSQVRSRALSMIVVLFQGFNRVQMDFVSAFARNISSEVSKKSNQIVREALGDPSTHPTTWFYAHNLIMSSFAQYSESKDVLLATTGIKGESYFDILMNAVMSAIRRDAEELVQCTLLSELLLFVNSHSLSSSMLASSSSVFSLVDCAAGENASVCVRGLCCAVLCAMLPLLPDGGSQVTSGRFVSVLSTRIGLENIEKCIADLVATPAFVHASNTRPEDLVPSSISLSDCLFHHESIAIVKGMRENLHERFVEMYSKPTSKNMDRTTSTSEVSTSSENISQMRSLIQNLENKVKLLAEENVSLKDTMKEKSLPSESSARKESDDRSRSEDELIRRLERDWKTAREEAAEAIRAQGVLKKSEADLYVGCPDWFLVPFLNVLTRFCVPHVFSCSGGASLERVSKNRLTWGRNMQIFKINMMKRYVLRVLRVSWRWHVF